MSFWDRIKLLGRLLRHYLSLFRSFVLYHTVEPGMIRKQQCLNKILEKELKKKDIINVCFFVLDDSIWKYDDIYRLMMQHERFNPCLLVTPFMTFNEIDRIEMMERTFTVFENRGYNVIRSYDKKNATWLNVMDVIKPDIVFYTNPYEVINKEEYYIKKLSTVLSCYISYGYMLEKYRWEYDLLFHNLLWLQFSESQENHQISSRLMRTNGTNNVVTGYPLYDTICIKGCSKDVWKIKDPRIKRIIWAPHHLVDSRGVSNFFSYFEIMFDLAQKYEGKIQVAFKPHPLLIQKLYNWPGWGKEKTDQYYQKWADLKNGQYECGDYIDLFLGSDAIIHDCMSFTIEYLYTLKPALFLDRKNSKKNIGKLKYNKTGLESYRMHYHAYTSNDIYNFIDKVVLGGNDSLYLDRKDFFNKNLLPPNGKSVANNVMDVLTSYL